MPTPPPADLDARILAVVARAPGGMASHRWIEVHVLAEFYLTNEALEYAPDRFPIRNAIWDMVNAGRLFVVGRDLVRLP